MIGRTKNVVFLLLLLLTGINGYSGNKEADYGGFLKEVMVSESPFWVRIHAAEALVDNNFEIDPEEVFKQELNSNGEKRTGVLRVMAKKHVNDSLVFDSLSNEILSHYLAGKDMRTKLVSLETMGKLGLYFPDKGIERIAADSTGGIQVLAQWAVSNSGDKKDMAVLAQFLNSPDTLQFRYAAYALGFKKNLPSDILSAMKKKYSELSKDHPFRIYLLSALFRQSPTEYRGELLKYSNGRTYERYELFNALSDAGAKEDIDFIESGFNDSDTDVKIAVSRAFLSNEHFLQNKISIIDWIILVIYGILLVGIGWYYSYRQKSKEDYFLGGRSVSPFLSGISMFVSFFSAITYLAVPGETIQYGPLYVLGIIAGTPVIFLVASYFLIPFFMNLPIISAYEILQKPLGKAVRKTGSVIFIITRFLWMGLLLFLASKVMVVMMGWDERYILYVIVILAIITIFYTSMGGLKAVLMTDVIQFFILLLGALLTIGIVAVEFGGFGWLIPDSWSDNWDSVGIIDFNPYVRLTIFFAVLNNIAWWLCTSGSDQMAIQRFLSTRDLKAARRTFLYTQTGNATIISLLMFVGFAVLRFYNVHPNLLPAGTTVSVNADFLFPHFIANQFPVGMSGLVIAALFSASMSSLSSGVNSVSSILTSDILPGLYKDQSKVDNIRNIRINSFLIGVVVVFLSIIIQAVPGNIIEVTAKTNGLFIAPLFNLFLNALFIKNATPQGAVMGSVYGFMTALTIGFWDVMTGNPPLSFLWIATCSLIVSVLSSILFNFIYSKFSKVNSFIIGIILMLPWLIYYLYILT